MTQDKIKAYREVIETENVRVNERLTILSQFQGLLFASLALGWEKSESLTYLLCGIGIISGIAITRSLYMAQWAIIKLYLEYLKLPAQERNAEGPVIGNFPKRKSFIPIWMRIFLTPAIVLPVLMILAWIAIVFIKYYNLK